MTFCIEMAKALKTLQEESEYPIMPDPYFGPPIVTHKPNRRPDIWLKIAPERDVAPRNGLNFKSFVLKPPNP